MLKSREFLIKDVNYREVNVGLKKVSEDEGEDDNPSPQGEDGNPEDDPENHPRFTPK